MLVLVRFIFLVTLKAFCKIFYRFKVRWVSPPPAPELWAKLRLGALLNHTSLFEPIFVGTLPQTFLWRLARCGSMPVADATLSRPLAGTLIRFLAPRTIALTRKRDETWTGFIATIPSDALIMIAPEGRMRRPNGLDKDGRPMTVRGGIVDLLLLLQRGQFLLGYSGGLHHIQSPGQGLPKLFKTASITYEWLQIEDYLQAFTGLDKDVKRAAIIADLEQRRDRYAKML